MNEVVVVFIKPLLLPVWSSLKTALRYLLNEKCYFWMWGSHVFAKDKQLYLIKRWITETYKLVSVAHSSDTPQKWQRRHPRLQTLSADGLYCNEMLLDTRHKCLAIPSIFVIQLFSWSRVLHEKLVVTPQVKHCMPFIKSTPSYQFYPDHAIGRSPNSVWFNL